MAPKPNTQNARNRKKARVVRTGVRKNGRTRRRFPPLGSGIAPSTGSNRCHSSSPTRTGAFRRGTRERSRDSSAGTGLGTSARPSSSSRTTGRRSAAACAPLRNPRLPRLIESGTSQPATPLGTPCQPAGRAPGGAIRRRSRSGRRGPSGRVAAGDGELAVGHQSIQDVGQRAGSRPHSSQLPRPQSGTPPLGRHRFRE
jgi:hypothetical protein